MRDIHMWANTTPWSLARAALQASARVFLWGPPGVGKSYLTANAGRPLLSVTLCDDHTVQELVGHYVPEGQVFRWHDGPVAVAMRQGSLLVLNEVGRASGSVQDFLLGVLDSPEVGGVALPSGDRLLADPDFAVVATSNAAPDALDRALRSRFDVEIHLPLPNPELITMLNLEIRGLGDALADSFRDPARAIDPRKLLAMVRLVKRRVATRSAAAMCFGSSAPDLLAALSARGVRLP
jgi:nitric oxide reductase NorQ protein